MKSGPILLVTMPFAPVVHPSPALGALAGALRRAGFEARCVYGNILFTDLVHANEYMRIAQGLFHFLTGDWLFSRAAFPDKEDRDDEYLRLCSPQDEKMISLLRSARESGEQFVFALAEKIVAQQPLLVGCTTGFSQLCAGIALLRHVKKLSPGTATILGGADCEGEMGRALHSKLHWVDYVFSGEADNALPELCARLRDGALIGGLGWNTTGLITPADREAGYARDFGREVVHDMDSLPDPEYDDYYQTLESVALGKYVDAGLIMETSRGCWWGQKKGCNFCGLNGIGKTYRAKDPAAAGDLIRRMSKRYKTKIIEFTDNIIPPSYIDGMLPGLKDDGLSLFYEITPRMTRQQLEVLSDAGVRWVQPGIEGLDDDVLKLLGKTNRLLDNIRLLKWARELGISMVWNMLACVPGEDPDWYSRVSGLVPLLTHLQPPTAPCVPVHFDRFSPWFNNRHTNGIRMKPLDAYRYVFPFTDAEIEEFACFFHYDSDAPFPSYEMIPEQSNFLRTVYEWMLLDAEKKPELSFTGQADGSALITDTRPAALEPEIRLTPEEAALYDFCDAGATLPEAADAMSGLSLESNEIQALLDDFIRRKLMIVATGKYIGLAVHAPCRPRYPVERLPGAFHRKQVPPDTVSVWDAFGLNRETHE